MPVLLKFGYPL